MHYLIQATTQKSVRLTLKHVIGSCSESSCYLPARGPFHYATGESEKGEGNIPSPVAIHPAG